MRNARLDGFRLVQKTAMCGNHWEPHSIIVRWTEFLSYNSTTPSCTQQAPITAINCFTTIIRIVLEQLETVGLL